MRRNKIHTSSSRFIICAIILLIIVNAKPANAQDPRFSQFFTSPLTLNPALTGKSIADWRALSNYRSQWFGSGIHPFTTTSFSLEKKLTAGTQGTDAFGAGLLLLSESSNNGILKNNQLVAGLSYSKSLDKENRRLLSAGISITYNDRLFDAGKMLFESQFGNGGFQSSASGNDAASSGTRAYSNINAGLHYSFTGKRTGYYAGISYFHIAHAGDGLANENNVLSYPRLSIQAGYQYHFENDHRLAFSAVMDNQAGVLSATAGLLLKLSISGSNLNIRSVNMGIWDRFGDAVYPYFGIEFSRNWLLGLSYDIVTSQIAKTMGSLQTLELSFGWQFSGKRKTAELNKQDHVLMY